MQKIILVGNIGRDAELIKLGDKEQVKFSLACTEGKGEKKTTTWYDVLSYATGIINYLTKGSKVVVFGRLDIRTSQGKDGKTYTNINVWADNVELCRQHDTQAQPTQSPMRQDPNPTSFTQSGWSF